MPGIAFICQELLDLNMAGTYMSVLIKYFQVLSIDHYKILWMLPVSFSVTISPNVVYDFCSIFTFSLLSRSTVHMSYLFYDTQEENYYIMIHVKIPTIKGCE